MDITGTQWLRIWNRFICLKLGFIGGFLWKFWTELWIP